MEIPVASQMKWKLCFDGVVFPTHMEIPDVSVTALCSDTRGGRMAFLLDLLSPEL